MRAFVSAENAARSVTIVVVYCFMVAVLWCLFGKVMMIDYDAMILRVVYCVSVRVVCLFVLK